MKDSRATRMRQFTESYNTTQGEGKENPSARKNDRNKYVLERWISPARRPEASTAWESLKAAGAVVFIFQHVKQSAKRLSTLLITGHGSLFLRRALELTGVGGYKRPKPSSKKICNVRVKLTVARGFSRWPIFWRFPKNLGIPRSALPLATLNCPAYSTSGKPG